MIINRGLIEKQAMNYSKEDAVRIVVSCAENYKLAHGRLHMYNMTCKKSAALAAVNFASQRQNRQILECYWIS